MKKVIYTKNAPEAIGPYSQAILSNNTLYTSGQIAINPISGDLIMDSITNETHQVMKNLQAVLEAAEMNFSHVLKCTIFFKRYESICRYQFSICRVLRRKPSSTRGCSSQCVTQKCKCGNISNSS